MTTIEKNIIIAVFMDGVIIGSGERQMIAFPDVKIDGGGSISNNRSVSDLHYHSDWNWLMGVVNKIDKLNGGDFRKLPQNIIDGLLSVDILLTTNGCFEFIQWYNQNK